MAESTVIVGGGSHAPVDPGLVLPPAVQAQRDRANALMAGLNGTTALTAPASPVQPNGGDPGAQAQPTPGPPPGGLPMELVEAGLDLQRPTNPSPQPFNLNGSGTSPQAPTGPGGSPQAPGTSGGPPDAQNYERLYKALKGRWDGEVAQMRQSLMAVAQRNQQLEGLLAGMQQGGQPPANGQMPNGNYDPAQDFTQDEIEQWGPEMLSMFSRLIDKRAQAAAGAQVQPMIADRAAERKRAMFELLWREVPNWQEINLHPSFMQWSFTIDPFSGEMRQNLMRRAFEAGDGPRVANFFKAFLSELSAAPAAPEPGPQPVQPLAPVQLANGGTAPQQPPSQRIALSELAAPSGSGGSAAPPAPAAKRVYRRSEIARFYSDKALNRFPADQAALVAATEADIFSAQAEGRVING